MAGVSRDASSGVYAPATAAEWQTAFAAAGISGGTPSNLWLLQEASGDLADSVGDGTLTNASMSYQQSVSGWTRKAMTSPDLDAPYMMFNATGSSMPDLSAESGLLLTYAGITAAPAADRCVLLLGGSNSRGIVTSGLAPKMNNGTNTATGAANVGTAVRPWVLRHNVTASTSSVFTNQEKVAPTFAASAGGKKVFFNGAVETAAGAQFLYAACFKGSSAELSDAQLRTLLQRLGWSVAW